MDPTTLITFLFRAPPGIRAVELLGSWDNFRQPYVMHHDRRRGHGAWSGCFKFENIMFDGSSNGDLVFNIKPRRGGLKQGGTYWYYYRLDYDVDAYDDAKEYTTGCPLLPGQPVNVIEIPVEILPPPSRRRSACMEFENVEGTLASLKSMPRYALNQPSQTLDPNSKFAALNPPPISRVHGRCVSDLALNGRLETRPATPTETRDSVTPHVVEEIVQLHSSRYSEDATAYHSVSHSRAASDAGSSIYNGYPEEASVLACGHPDPLRSFPTHDNGGGISMASGFDKPSFGGSRAGSPDHGGTQPLSPLAEHDSEDDDDDSQYGPRSIRDIQIYGSRPTTSYSRVSQDFWRPRVHSVVPGGSQHHCVQAPPSIAESHSSGDGYASPSTGDDLWSPTFSAATLSSNGGGLNTPFRLSATYTPDHAHATQEEHGDNQDVLCKVATRLSTVEVASTDSSPYLKPPETERDNERTPTFGAYALPLPAMESVQSLGKVSSTTESLHTSLSPLPLVLPDTSARSMADDIFSELGYLSGSIN